jgi:hypothetical protein
MNTDIVVSLGDKVRRTSSFIMVLTYKIVAEKDED